VKEFHSITAQPVPSVPSLTATPDLSLQGTVAYFDNGSRCVLTDFDSRTLLTMRSPGEYTYGLEPASWAPDGKWIVTTESGGGAGGDWRTPMRFPAR